MRSYSRVLVATVALGVVVGSVGLVAPAAGDSDKQLAQTAKKKPKLPRGRYDCYQTDVNGFPTLAATIHVSKRAGRYSGPGKTNAGRYSLSSKTKRIVVYVVNGVNTYTKARKVKFKSGAYGGWNGYYFKDKGTPVIDLRSPLGSVGSYTHSGNGVSQTWNGCPRTGK